EVRSWGQAVRCSHRTPRHSQEGHPMSEYGDLDTGHEDHGHENYELDHGHEAHGHEHDHFQNFQSYGEHHAHEYDQQYGNVHHVEYDDGKGGRYEETDVTVYDQHAAGEDSAYAQEYTDKEHSQSYAELDYLHEQFDGELEQYGHEHGSHGYDGHEYGEGHQQLSAVSN